MTIAIKGKDSPEGLAGDKYFKLIEHAADGIAIIQDGVFKLVNTAITRISGYDKEELLGMPFTKLLTPQSQKLTVERYQARLVGKKVPQIYEIQAVTKNSQIRYIELNAALTEYDGRPADEVIIRDTTEHKQVEHDLQERMKELVGLYGISSIAERPGITLDEIYQEIVKLFPQSWQYPEVVCAQLTIDGKEFKTANYRETEWKQFADIKVHGIKAGMVVVSYLEERPASDEGPFLKEERSLIDTVAERLGKITERKQAEEALADEATRRRILIDQSRDGIVILDQNGKVYEANQQFAEMLGYTPEEVRQLSVFDWEYLYPREQVLEMIRTVDEAGDHFETKHRRKDGSTYDVEISTNGAAIASQKLIFCVCRDVTERKQAEETIHQQNEFLNNILNSLTHPFYVLDADDYTVKMANLATKAVNLSGKPTCYALTHKVDQPCRGADHICPLEEVKKTKKPVVVEHVHYDEDGNARNIEVHGYPIFDAEGNVVQMIEYSLDITQRKQAEEALGESEEKYKELAESVTDLFFAFDKDLRYTYWNKASEELTGISAKDALGKHLYDIFPDSEMTKSAKRAYLKALQTQKVQSFVNEYQLGDKDYFFEISAYPSKGGLVVLAKDITERKQMEQQLLGKNEQLDSQNEELRSINEELQATEEELQHSQERLERMFESVTDGIVVADLDSTIIKVNEKAVQMHGFASDDELMGKKTFELIAPHDRKRKANNVWNKLKEGTLSGGEYTLLKADGSEFPGELSTSALKDASGKVIGHITTVRDITERKRAEEREKQLEQELNLAGRLASIGQLAAGVAHEINNPLTGVIGFSHLMLNRDIPNDMKEDLQVINSEALRVAKIVENLLVFAHQRKTGREYVAINDIITRVLELRAYEMKVNNIEVGNQLDPDLPLTMADAGQLQQVFLNIILNAEHSMTKAHHKGNLLVKTKQINGNIRASFTDNGAGISKENLDNIFNPFFTTKEVGKGTGLGLSICHGIITQHKGRIYAQSQPGKGATFVIELPIVADPVQAGKAKVTKKEPQKSRGAKILVVDDEAAILTFLSRLLTEWGHSVETINTADAALERLKTERYGLILLDIKLPGMSGIELYHHIEEIAPALTRRVMFITGDIMEGTTRNFLEKAGVPHITKPLDIEVLKKTINHILN